MGFVRVSPSKVPRQGHTAGRPPSTDLRGMLSLEMGHYSGLLLTPSPRMSAADITMGLAPTARGRGLGTQMLQLTLDRIRAENQAIKMAKDLGSSAGQGIEILYLMVREDNQAAIALYHRLGFAQVAVLHKDTKINDGLYYDGIMMRLFV